MRADAGGGAGVCVCAGAGAAGAGLCWPAANAGKASRIKAERLRCFKGWTPHPALFEGTDYDCNGDIGSRKAWLGERRCARRDIAGNFSGNDNGYGEILKPVDGRRHFHRQRGGKDRRPGRRTDGAGMRIDGLRTQVQAAVKLRPEQDTGEERRQEKGEFGATAHFCRVSSLIIVHPEGLPIADFRME